ncbi:hypothetical protein LINGRAHAP2_LOCUS7911 [Linum grandiflorum]
MRRRSETPPFTRQDCGWEHSVRRKKQPKLTPDMLIL